MTILKVSQEPERDCFRRLKDNMFCSLKALLFFRMQHRNFIVRGWNIPLGTHPLPSLKKDTPKSVFLIYGYQTKPFEDNIFSGITIDACAATVHL